MIVKSNTDDTMVAVDVTWDIYKDTGMFRVQLPFIPSKLSSVDYDAPFYWCRDNIAEGGWRYVDYLLSDVYYFTKEEDATHFALKWA